MFCIRSTLGIRHDDPRGLLTTWHWHIDIVGMVWKHQPARSLADQADSGIFRARCAPPLHVDSKVVDGCEDVKLTAYLLLGKADGSVMADGTCCDLVTVLMDDPLPWAINIYLILYIYMYTLYYCIAFYNIVSIILYINICILLYIIVYHYIIIYPMGHQIPFSPHDIPMKWLAESHLNLLEARVFWEYPPWLNTPRPDKARA